MAALQTYLNDHLAGAAAALKLLAHLTTQAEDPKFAEFCGGLRAEVQADAEELRGLMQRLDFPESSVKKAGAWLTEKVTEAKLLIAGEGASELGRLQALEALCLGITGKRALWAALQTVQDSSAAWASMELPRLIARAEEQHARTDAERLATARKALSCANR